MEKKLQIITLMITALFLVTCLSNVLSAPVPQIEDNKEFFIGEKYITLNFLEPMIKEKDNFLKIEMNGTNTHLYRAGEPMLPLHASTLSFPFGTKIISIKCDTSIVKNMVLPNKIIPAPKPIVQDTNKNSIDYEPDAAIYKDNSFYPGNWYNYYTGGGLNQQGKHETFLTLHAYPLLYNPVANTLSYTHSLTHSDVTVKRKVQFFLFFSFS